MWIRRGVPFWAVEISRLNCTTPSIIFLEFFYNAVGYFHKKVLVTIQYRKTTVWSTS